MTWEQSRDAAWRRGWRRGGLEGQKSVPGRVTRVNTVSEFLELGLSPPGPVAGLSAPSRKSSAPTNHIPQMLSPQVLRLGIAAKAFNLPAPGPPAGTGLEAASVAPGKQASPP